jgi:SAM-dependent methyltransferase
MKTYDPALFEELFRAEDKHFWFRSRNRVIASMVRTVTASFPNGYSVLEVGCGDGNVLRVLEKECKRGSVTGTDLYEEGLRLARHRTSCSLVAGDINSLTFPLRFDLIGMFDVLEHLPNDGEVLRSLHRLLSPGRCLLLTVPAHMSLWSYFDVGSCHCRRYSLGGLRDRLVESGFHVEFISQFMMPLFPLMWLARRFRKNHLDPQKCKERMAGEMKVVPVFNEALLGLLSLEANWLSRRRSIPLGTSLIALARRD